MLGLLPALFIAACVAAVRRRSDGAGTGWRDAIAPALLAAGTWSAIGGELLGLGAALTFWPVVVWWSVPTVIVGALAYTGRSTDQSRGTAEQQTAGLDAHPDQSSPLHPFTPSPPHPLRSDLVTGFLIAATAIIVLVTGLVALLTPPNTWDSLMYHLPRQVHWMQQGSLAHYPSHDLRQLEFPPMAEAAGVQLMILSGGGDHWANMLQWAAFLGCVLIASAIARDLGAGARGQALAALLVATIPGAVHQAVNAKNDLVVALWACILAWFAVRIRLERTCGPLRAAWIGLALGLLLYTKGTGYIFALPLGALLGAWMLPSLRLRAVPAALIIGLIAAVLNAGHWRRNHETFGNPLGLIGNNRGYRLTNETAAPAAMLSNVIRNIALHTQTPSEPLNDAQQRWVRRVHEALGVGTEDPRTTSPARTTYAIRWTLAQDGSGGAPVHLLLAALAPGVLAALPRRSRSRKLRSPAAGTADPGPAWGLGAAGLGAALLFCLVLKWQPWHARLQIPIFVLLAPVCGLALPRMPGGPAKGLLVLGALGLAVWAMLINDSKPLIGDRGVLTSTREQTLFHHDLYVRDATVAAIDSAAEFRPRVVGVAPGVSAFDYAIQRLLVDRLKPPARIVSGRHNFGPAPPPGSPDPDVILAWHATGAAMSFRPGARGYASVAQFLPLTVYAREEFIRDVRPEGRDVESMPFMGWSAVEGLGPLHGPFPQWNLPVVRWATAKRTRLTFGGTGPAAELVLECRRGVADNQSLAVFLNGERVYRFEFGPERQFSTHRIPLRPREGTNEIEIRHAQIDRPPSGQERAVLYRKIQIIPRPGVQ